MVTQAATHIACPWTKANQPVARRPLLYNVATTGETRTNNGLEVSFNLLTALIIYVSVRYGKVSRP